jgi:hypothetical protein
MPSAASVCALSLRRGAVTRGFESHRDVSAFPTSSTHTIHHVIFANTYVSTAFALSAQPGSLETFTPRRRK